MSSRRYFGTDGIRGVAGEEPLTAEFALRVGVATVELLRREGVREPRVVVGMDTRRSGSMLASAAAAGMASRGADVTLLGVLPTPGVSFMTRALGAHAGLMVSASHNPFHDNGLKLFGADGVKLTDAEEAAIEELLAELGSGGGGRAAHLEDVSGAQLGRVSGGPSVPYGSAETAAAYMEHLLSHAPYLDGLRVALDCAHGAAHDLAPLIFRRIGARVEVLNAQPNGENINAECGSTHPDALARRVVEGGFDVGVTFDGDADRALLVDELGRVVSGDLIVAIAALWRGESEAVVTQMTNFGVERYLLERGVKLHRTQIGDRYVLEELLGRGLTLGGEQSGHVLFLDKSPTGDGILTALLTLAAVRASQRTLKQWVDEVPIYPQRLVNVPVPLLARDSLPLETGVLEAVTAAEERLGGGGRLLLRPSGTEPLVRVMAEGEDGELVDGAAELVANAVRTAAEGALRAS